ncbi:radical SAM protein [Sphingomonas mesophila]|uniref:radical SAM protein n=1 Tax=Sphingomonas mesophila TaxID=2303576 RepID=UPI001F07BE8B|nr:radical SAM protein [Sphingomonas mesophila]
MSATAISLGCRLNFAEAEAMAAGAPDGTIIVNSCAVTAEAVRQTRQAIRRARRDRPDARVVVTGCAAQLEPEAFAAVAEVDEVWGNGVKGMSAPLINHIPFPFVSSEVETPLLARPSTSLGTNGKILLPPISHARPHAGLLHKVKSFVAIQAGCDHRCTFCTIWQARGPSRSVPYAEVRDAVARELDRGAREVVLTGVDITDYACPELGRGGLGLLCQRLLADLPALHRLRLSSLDSVEIDGALLELIAGEPRLLPHFHLSLQAGDDLILKRMKRRHSRADAVATVAAIKLARPDATIGADLIAGFPTESEEAALNTLRLLDDCDIVAAHIFPFSPRPGTPAARMPQVEREVVKARAARLREAAAVRRAQWLDTLVGTRQAFLMESDILARSDNEAPIRLAGARRGDIGTALVTGRDGETLVGVRA